MSLPLLGAHMSIAGGLHLAIERGEELGCTAIQIFTKNASQWKAKPISPEDAEAFRTARAASNIGPVLGHDSYLINLATTETEQREKSLAAFIDEMERVALLGLDGLVMHPGSPKDAGTDAGISALVDSLKRALEQVPTGRILVENVAGQGASIGRSIEELARILDGVGSDRVGLCIDSCHAFAAGYDLAHAEGYDSFWQELDRLIGIDRVWALHLNDSKKGVGSKVDRHDHIGAGELGIHPFRRLMTDLRLALIPKIIETPAGPGADGIPMDRVNLDLLRRLARGEA